MREGTIVDATLMAAPPSTKNRNEQAASVYFGESRGRTGHSAADSGQLASVLAAVKRNVGDDPQQVLADAGYRSEAMFEQLRDHPSELIVALGRDGKQELTIDPNKRPLCAAMAEKFKCAATREAYRKRKWISEPPNAWVKSVLGFRQFSLRGLAKAQAEWKLVCAALNLRRMATMLRT